MQRAMLFLLRLLEGGPSERQNSYNVGRRDLEE